LVKAAKLLGFSIFLQLPVPLLMSVQGSTIVVDLENGERYHGYLTDCDTSMNIHLREVICTSKVFYNPSHPVQFLISLFWPSYFVL
jgi:small nuclear ribonucleoprotein (snRNP)-like protein